MYRIEVTPGEETVFRTMEELAVAIRNGVVTPRARIYHNASQKWLPIGLHPHYKKAMELPAASSAHPKTPTPVPAKAPSKPRVELHPAEYPAEPTPAASATARVATPQSATIPWTDPRPQARGEALLQNTMIAAHNQARRQYGSGPLAWA